MKKNNFEQVVVSRLSDSDLKVSDIAQSLNISERTLRNQVHRLYGLSPVQYLTELRLRHALLLLQHRQYATIAETCSAVGIKSAAHFSRIFKEKYGFNPSILK